MKKFLIFLAAALFLSIFTNQVTAGKKIYVSDVNVTGDLRGGGKVLVTIENRESFPISLYCGLTFVSHDNLYFDQPYSSVRILKKQRKIVELKWKSKVGGHVMKPGKYITWIGLWGKEVRNPNYKRGVDPPHLRKLLDNKIAEKKVRVYIK